MTPAVTARIVVKDDVDSELFAAIPDCEVSREPGAIHLTVRLHGAADVYSLLNRIRGLGTTLIRLRVDQPD